MRIRARMGLEFRWQLKQPIMEHVGVLAWSHKDIPNINIEIIEYNLCINPKARTIQQKQRSFSIKNAAIMEEVDASLLQGSSGKPITQSGSSMWF